MRLNISLVDEKYCPRRDSNPRCPDDLFKFDLINLISNLNLNFTLGVRSSQI